MYAINSKNLQ